MEQNRSFEIFEQRTETALNLAVELLYEIGRLPFLRDLGRVKWQDKRGLFHTCRIRFSVRHEDGKSWIDIRHCEHTEYVVILLSKTLIRHKLIVEHFSVLQASSSR